MLIHLFIGSIRQALSGASKMAALVTLLSLGALFANGPNDG